MFYLWGSPAEDSDRHWKQMQQILCECSSLQRVVLGFKETFLVSHLHLHWSLSSVHVHVFSDIFIPHPLLQVASKVSILLWMMLRIDNYSRLVSKEFWSMELTCQGQWLLDSLCAQVRSVFPESLSPISQMTECLLWPFWLCSSEWLKLHAFLSRGISDHSWSDPLWTKK